MVKNQLVNKAIDYIMENLNDHISIEDVSNHCNISKFHFSRIFKKNTGESLYSFIKRLKMEKSALRIKTYRDKSITNIAYDFGYSSSNYSSAFKEYYKISPISFRTENIRAYIYNPFSNNKRYDLKSFAYYDKNMRIEELEDIRVIYERSIGNYSDLKNQWCEFIDRYRDFIDKDTLFIERSYDDPTITNLDRCLYDICITVDGRPNMDNTMLIKGGKFLVYHFESGVEDIFTSFQGIFGVWLPNTNYEIDKRFGFEIYRSIDSKNMYFIMDFYIPIK